MHSSLPAGMPVKCDGSRAQPLPWPSTAYLTAAHGEEVTKFEVVAGRVERGGGMCRRFACALPRRSWVTEAAIDASNAVPRSTPGGQATYSDRMRRAMPG